MTVTEGVARTRKALAAIIAARAVLAGIAAALVAYAAVAAVGALLGAGASALWPLTAASVAGVAVTSWLARRDGIARLSTGAVALWIEERQPDLRYALVTAIEGGPTASALERELHGADWSPLHGTTAWRATRLPLAAAIVAALLAVVMRSALPAVERVRAGRTAQAVPPGAGGVLDVSARIEPPAYLRLPAQNVRNPTVIRAIERSTVSITSDAADLRLTIDGAATGTGAAGDRAVLSLRLPAQPAALLIEGGGRSRLVALEPVPDSAPVVVLRLPARDTVLRDPRGRFSLGADVRDDHGLAAGLFEYIVSSGSGEAFTFVTGTTGRRRFSGARTGSLSARITLEQLGLEPGDVVHIRAIASDARSAADSLDARGTSETRSIRIARAGEYDSVAVEAAAPPEADRSLLSQRMLINLTEALVAKRSSLPRAEFSEESRRIARDQARLRRQVGEIVFSRLGDDPTGEHFHGDGHEHEGQVLRPALTPDEILAAADRAAAAAGQMLDLAHDDAPIMSINRPLLEAYNAMWEAGRELEQAAPQRALPPMYRALAAIQRARAAERLYLRGAARQAVVDLPRVRLTGTERGDPVDRIARQSAARALLERFERVLALVARSPAAAADSLLLLRIELVGRPGGAAGAATALADAAEALRAGSDATDALRRARRAIEVGASAADSLSRWSGSR